jgi:hypothetical protein
MLCIWYYIACPRRVGTRRHVCIGLRRATVHLHTSLWICPITIGFYVPAFLIVLETRRVAHRTPERSIAIDSPTKSVVQPAAFGTEMGTG